MLETELAHQLTFIVNQQGEEETTVLAKAVREGLAILYREALVEAYLKGDIQREQLINELGAEQVADIDYQRDAFQRDIAWGLMND